MCLSTSTSRLTRRSGFTLIEMLIVMVIIGVLASLVIAQFRNSTDDAARSAFVSSGKAFIEAAQRYQLDYGDFPENADSGVLPAGFGDYVQANYWEGGTPIGGVWDAEKDSFGITSGVGVHFDGTGETRDDAYMQQVDRSIDDGNLTSGGFRKIADDRYYFIVAY
jgi:prepilin-type N-terminal cleavage/methylation domain-containing protein